MSDPLDKLIAGLNAGYFEHNVEITSEKGSGRPSSSRVISNNHCLQVNPQQKGNPLLKYVKSVPWEYEDIIADYQMGTQICALFLSLQYHILSPFYIQDRLKRLGKKYELRVLLLLLDIDEPQEKLIEMSRICFLGDLTLMLAWTYEEAAKVLETYKIYEHKSPDLIIDKSEDYTYLKLVETLTSIKSINKTDAMILITKFGTFENIIKASKAQLSECPGFGKKKVKKLYRTLHENFLKN